MDESEKHRKVAHMRHKRQKALTIIRAAVATAFQNCTMWDLAQPRMRAALASHKALLSMLQQDQQDMAYLVQPEASITPSAIMPVLSISTLAWDDGLGPLHDSLIALTSPNSDPSASASLVQWPLQTIQQAQWYFEWKGVTDAAFQDISQLPKLMVVEMLTSIGMPEILAKNVEIPAVSRAQAPLFARLDNSHLQQLQAALIPASRQQVQLNLRSHFGLASSGESLPMGYCSVIFTLFVEYVFCMLYAEVSQ